MYGEESERIRAMLLDSSDLQISKAAADELRAAGSNENSIRVYVSLSAERTPLFPSIALIDLGSTAPAFADIDHVVRRHGIVTKPLLHPKPLRLADGIPLSFITHYFLAKMNIGHHTETLLFYVTKLAPATPIILGMPWLRTHDPDIRWTQPRIYFHTYYCRIRCLPWQFHDGVATAPLVRPAYVPQLARPSNYRPPTVEDVPDEGEKLQATTPSPTRRRQHRKRRPVQKPRQINQPIRHPTLRDLPITHPGSRLTKKVRFDLETRAVETAPPPRQPSRPLPALMVSGRRLKSCLKGRSEQCRQPPPASGAERPNMNDIRSTRAANFVQFCKQKGVQVMRLHMSELAEVVDEAINLDLLNELPTGLLELP